MALTNYCEDDDEFPKVPSAGDIQRVCKKTPHVLGTATRREESSRATDALQYRHAFVEILTIS
jgi:hypothetical protein